MEAHNIEPLEVALRDFLSLKQLVANAKWRKARDLWETLRADLNDFLNVDNPCDCD